MFSLRSYRIQQRSIGIGVETGKPSGAWTENAEVLAQYLAPCLSPYSARHAGHLGEGENDCYQTTFSRKQIVAEEYPIPAKLRGFGLSLAGRQAIVSWTYAT